MTANMTAMLKEWSTVVGAMEAGEQSVLLRKGGIMEAASGFVVRADRFLLYPTWEHQNPKNIREPYRRHLDRPRPPAGTNLIGSYAEVLAQADVSSGRAVAELEPFHIWSREYVESRRGWQPHRPLKAVYVRTFRIKPVSLPVLGEYGGCKSWLDADMGGCAGAPVRDEESVRRDLAEFGRIVS